MKTSKYINKYDYINYYTKQPAFWFFSNQEINDALEKLIQKYSSSIDSQDLDIDDEEYDFYDETDENSIDCYEFYKEIKNESSSIDNEDPRIIEGLIIDEKSRKFIKNQYLNITKSIDFENDDNYKGFNQEIIAECTKKAILENQKIILFQPVFIYKNLITKPDAIIKDENEIILIETKSTTTAKRHHLLDVFFQYNVLSRIDYLQDFYFNLELCLVKYDYANKREVPMVTTNSFNYLSTANCSGIESIFIKQQIKLGLGVYSKKNDEYDESPISLSNVCELNFNDFDTRYEIITSQSKNHLVKNKDKIKADLLEFDKTIRELELWKENMIDRKIKEVDITMVHPHPNDKSYWKKDNQLFALLRNIYSLQGHNLFKYSGNLVNQTNEALTNYDKDHDVFESFKNKDNINLFNESAPLITINQNEFKKLFSTLKNKKVYFDFETINSPIRPIDNCLPFMQIITQCSIIIDDQTKNVKDLDCNNIVIDPLNISIDCFKNIVDALFMGDEFSYVVYNKNFEKSRLKEIAQFINESEYTNKINIIINNLHDLADYFRVKANLTPVLIKNLGGFYSIKKVLPFIFENYCDIFNATGCVDYHSLDTIQNGLICQLQTTKRFHNLLNDNEWEKLVVNLKKYCENDVRAMIAVEYFLKTL